MPRKYTPRVSCVCLHCGTEFLKKLSDVKAGRGKFCSRQCHYDHVTSQSIDRFWSRVKKSDDCWEWQGRIESNGYGQTWMAGRNYATHRLAWELSYGLIPPGFHVCHHCDNRACVRPAHLFLGTHADNMRDRNMKGRQAKGTATVPASRPRGEAHHKAKLTVADVLAIRAATGVSKMELARRYGVSHPTIRHILARRIWKHI